MKIRTTLGYTARDWKKGKDKLLELSKRETERPREGEVAAATLAMERHRSHAPETTTIVTW